jgi:hypothetical protein
VILSLALREKLSISRSAAGRISGMRSLKKKISSVEGPSEQDKQARMGIAAVENITRRPGKPGPWKESNAGPVKLASRKTNPKPPDRNS